MNMNNGFIKNLSDAELDACILINPKLFGEMMLEEMGITGSFSSLKLEDGTKDTYRIAWSNSKHLIYSSVIDRYTIKSRLGDKKITATVVKV